MENSIDLISIIIPVYNAELTLERCLNSVIAQTYKNWEAIIVDDGSTDLSAQICEKFKNADNRVYYIKQQNLGVSEARNNGINKAQGKYISFLDADDYLESNYFETMQNVMKKESTDICICQNYNVTPNFNIDCTKLFTKIPKQITTIKSNEYDFFSPLSHWTVWGVLYKKEIIGDLSFRKDLFVGEDTYFLSEAIKKANKITFIDNRLLYYVISLKSACHGDYDEKKHTEIKAWKEIDKLFLDRPEQLKSIRAKFTEICAKNMKNYFLNKNKNKVLYSELKAEYRRNVPYAISESLKSHKFISVIKFISIYCFPSLMSRVYGILKK